MIECMIWKIARLQLSQESIIQQNEHLHKLNKLSGNWICLKILEVDSHSWTSVSF